MGGWHHRLDGHEFEQALGVEEGQGSLVCCSPWDYRVKHDLAAEQQQQPKWLHDNVLCRVKQFSLRMEGLAGFVLMLLHKQLFRLLTCKLS